MLKSAYHSLYSLAQRRFPVLEDTPPTGDDQLKAKFLRIEREMRLIFDVGVQLTRSLDLTVIGKALYDFISTLMPCDSFMVSTYHDDEKCIRAVYAYHEQQAVDVSLFPPLIFDASQPVEGEDRSTQGRAIRTGASLRIDDFDAYLDGRQSYYYDEGEMIDANSIDKDDGIARTRSALIVPLSLDAQVTGVVQVFSYRLAAFRPQDLRIVEALAPQVAIALKNARLYQLSQRYAQQLEALNTLDKLMLNAKPLQETLQTALDLLQPLVHFDRASLFVLEDTTDARLVAAYGEPCEWADVAPNVGAQGIVCVDVPRDDEVFLRCCQALEDGGNVLGLLVLEFDELAQLERAQTSTLQQFAAQLALAIKDQHMRAALAQQQTQLEAQVQARTVALEEALTRAEHLSAELRQAMQVERELGMLKARMVSMVSHEFRTPLAVILSSASLLSNYYERIEPSRRQEHLFRIMAQVEHLKTLLDDVILVGKADSDSLQLNLAPFDFNALCEQCIAELQPLFPTHRILFAQMGEPVPFYADALLIRQVLVNLLGNALKYSDAGKTVELRLEYLPLEVVLCVADEGIGIPPSDLARLGEPFHRASNTGKIQGTGLGLAIVQRAIQAHGGFFHVESAVNVGTKAYIRLPLRTTPF